MNKHISIPGNRNGAVARRDLKPIKRTPRAEANSSGRLDAETHKNRAFASDQADTGTQPTDELPDRTSSRSKRAADASIVVTIPTRPTKHQPSLTKAGKSRRRSGQVPIEAHFLRAGSATISEGHPLDDTHSPIAFAGDDGGHLRIVTPSASAAVIAEITQLWRMRQRWHRAEKSLILQGKAICRSFLAIDDLHSENEKAREKAQTAVKVAANKLFDSARAGEAVDPNVAVAIAPFLMSIDATFEPQRAALERRLRKLAEALPIWKSWGADIRGFGALSLAAIVGEAGDVGSFSNPAKLWKRMGLAVIGGERQRKKSGAEDALAHGFNPSRRAVMWNIGGGLIGGMGHGPRPRVGEDIEAREDWTAYQKMFVRVIRGELLKVSDTWDGSEHTRPNVGRNGEVFESYSSHVAARAKRRVEKQFLVDLLIAWKAAASQTRHEHLSIVAGGGK